MKKIDKVLKKLSDLYEFNRKIKIYKLKKEDNKYFKQDSANKRNALKNLK